MRKVFLLFLAVVRNVLLTLFLSHSSFFYFVLFYFQNQREEKANLQKGRKIKPLAYTTKTKDEAKNTLNLNDIKRIAHALGENLTGKLNENLK